MTNKNTYRCLTHKNRVHFEYLFPVVIYVCSSVVVVVVVVLDSCYFQCVNGGCVNIITYATLNM